jgi:hypothetical protein
LSGPNARRTINNANTNGDEVWNVGGGYVSHLKTRIFSIR